jgi:glycosyltransferase involved in cell wall biosynthesis
MRVVQVSFHLDAEQRDAETLLQAWPTLSAVANAAVGAGIDVAVVQAAHRTETVVRDGIRYQFVGDSSRWRTRVCECVAAAAPDAIHVQGLGSPRAIRRLASTAPDVPILVQDHGAVVPTGWRAKAWRVALAPIAAVTFTARDQADPWKWAKILRSDLPVFAVLESSSDFAPGDQDAARAFTGMHGDPCLFWTGRLDANKDPLTMLAAFERVTAELPEARLYCCFGEAPMLAEVAHRITTSEVLSKRVTLLGRRSHDEMELRYRSADFFLQASHREGSGYSLLEAMACGTTPLVTDIPAARAIVGDAGSLTPVRDAIALSDAIVNWSSRTRSELRRATRARFDAALTFEAIGRQLRAAYESVAGVSSSVSATDATLASNQGAQVREEVR